VIEAAARPSEQPQADFDQTARSFARDDRSPLRLSAAPGGKR
jgi:hypothetical protein